MFDSADVQWHDVLEMEAALRELARDGGPSVGRLQRAHEGSSAEPASLRALAAHATSVPSPDPRQRAAALFTLIEGEIAAIGEDPTYTKEHAALRAGFRIDMHAYRGEEYDLLERRLDLARSNNEFGIEASQRASYQFWIAGTSVLARNVATQLRFLSRNPTTWLRYVERVDSSPPSAVTADAQPVLVDRLVASYFLKERVVTEAVTERTVTATANNVDQYVVRANAPLGGEDRVRIEAMLNCRTGADQSILDGSGRYVHEVPVLLPERLMHNDTCFFSTKVSGLQNEDPIVEIMVTSHGIAKGGLTLRVQFDRQDYPSAAWWFGDCNDAQRLTRPPIGDPRRLTWTTFGYLTHTFDEACKPLARYGIAWEWSD